MWFTSLEMAWRLGVSETDRVEFAKNGFTGPQGTEGIEP